MNLLFFIVTAGFFLWLLQNTLFWVYLWQHNDYSFRRISAHLRETVQGRSIFFSPLSYYKIFLILVYGYIVLNPDFLAGYQFLVGSLYVMQGLNVIKKYYQHTLYMPKFTLKALALCIVSIVIAVMLFLVPLTQERYFWFLLVDKSIFYSILFFVFVFG